MWLQDGGAVTGWGACRLHGANFFDGLFPDGRTQMPVPVCVGPLGQLRTKPGISVSHERLGADEVVICHAIGCTPVRRALFDAMRTAPDVREAVVAMEMMAAAELVSIQQIKEYVDALPGWKGVAQVRAALELAIEDSRSPNETRMRLIWLLDAGLPRPEANQEVFDLRGQLIGVADLLDVEAGVVGEYDGADHRGAVRHTRDVAREEWFRGVGLEYFKVTGLDLPVRSRVAARMHAARARARKLSQAGLQAGPPGGRRWTIDPPPGWETPAMNLHERLEHRAWQISLLEQFERENPSLRSS